MTEPETVLCDDHWEGYGVDSEYQGLTTFCTVCQLKERVKGLEAEVKRLEDMLKDSGRVNLKLQADKKRLREAITYTLKSGQYRGAGFRGLERTITHTATTMLKAALEPSE